MAIAAAGTPCIDPRDLGRLRWRCRRGMKELDVLLSRYVDEQFCNTSTALQAAFWDLLQAEDPVIHGYLLGGEGAPTALLATLIGRITGRRDAARLGG